MVVCLYTIVTVLSCTTATDKLPEGILSVENMAPLVADLQLVEAAQKQLNLGLSEQNKMRDTSYHIIFNKYGVDSTLFDSSMRVYARHPQLMSDIMEQAAAYLNKQE